MLIQFSVGNYLSFRDRVTLSLVASGGAEYRERNTFEAPWDPRCRLLKTVGIYGPNASGKSNLIRAMGFVSTFVPTSAAPREQGTIRVSPFRLAPECRSQPSEFEVVFFHEGQLYRYGFKVDSEKVHEEWLSCAPKRWRLLFHRRLNEFRFGEHWRGERLKLAKATRPGALFLSVAAQFNNETAIPVVRWFDDRFLSITQASDLPSDHMFTAGMLEPGSKYANAAYAKAVKQLVEFADPGIRDLHAYKVTFRDAIKLRGGLSEPELDKLASVFKPVLDDPYYRVRTAHADSVGSTEQFDLHADESAGTQRMFALAGPWLYSLRTGVTLFVDELDTKLHHALSRKLVEMAHSSNSGSQVIFTSHDVSLMESDLFRRDQLWLVEKDDAGASQLVSLLDYKARKGESFRRGYLAGRYGALPVPGEIELGEES